MLWPLVLLPPLRKDAKAQGTKTKKREVMARLRDMRGSRLKHRCQVAHPTQQAAPGGDSRRQRGRRAGVRVRGAGQGLQVACHAKCRAQPPPRELGAGRELTADAGKQRVAAEVEALVQPLPGLQAATTGGGDLPSTCTLLPACCMLQQQDVYACRWRPEPAAGARQPLTLFTLPSPASVHSLAASHRSTVSPTNQLH